VQVKVILQRVEGLENIGKVREKRTRSFFPSDNRMHTEWGAHASKEVPGRVFVART